MSIKDAIGSAPAKIESIAPVTSYTTNGVVFAWGALTFNEILMLVATLCGVATFLVNSYYQKKRDEREARLLEAKINHLNNSAPSTGVADNQPGA